MYTESKTSRRRVCVAYLLGKWSLIHVESLDNNVGLFFIVFRLDGPSKIFFTKCHHVGKWISWHYYQFVWCKSHLIPTAFHSSGRCDLLSIATNIDVKFCLNCLCTCM